MAYTAYEPMTAEQIFARVQKYYPEGGSELVRKGYEFAEKAHAGQMRKSGEPYIVHPLYVASILTEIMIDPPTITAAFLHDTVEDCENVSLETIDREFGPEVAQLVDGVTKLGKLDFADREERQAESLRKMILAMSRDIRVVLIKLADRLHNMRTLSFQSPERQISIARETLDIYAPLAHRLGVYTIKQELEDLALRYIDPEGYKDVARKVGMKRHEREVNIQTVIQELSQKLSESGLKYDIDGRPKHLYSIYRKMVLQNKPFEQIYDLIAIRVIVETIPECYTVLGIVHTLWNQVPGRFKDYISVPKANMYRSLHTTVIGGRMMPYPFEIQIRTREMHQVAEFGIAAHWRYKEGGRSADNLDRKLTWLRQILDWQSETRDSKEFVDGLKTDLFSEEVFLFTPKGDIISMQRGSTPLDFAYRIHSAVGNSCTGARVNGKIVPLETELKTGDRVEIITGGGSKGPSMDWLKIVKTPQAKSKIRQYFKRELRGENILLGKDMLEHEAKHRGIKLSEYLVEEFYEPILKKYQFAEIEDIYSSIGNGEITAAYVVGRLIEEKNRDNDIQQDKPLPPEKVDQQLLKTMHGKASNGIYVHGQSGMLVRFAHCCNPVPGDDIVGYITRGRGVTIHKADCVNALHTEPERAVPVSWAEESAGSFLANIQLICYDHAQLLGELTNYVADLGLPITAISGKINKNKTCTVSMSLQVQSRAQLDIGLSKLQKRPDVIEAYRSAT